MTRVCLIGKDDSNLLYELLSSETARAALSSYDISEPWENTVAVTSVSLGASITLLNDLKWYLVRYTEDVILFDESVSESEWLSEALARTIREQDRNPAETGALLKIYGVVDNQLVEPMYIQRVGESYPSYDLREVDDTVLVRITEAEFG